MRRTEIINEIRNAEKAGVKFSNAECAFFRAIYDTESFYGNTPEDTIICSNNVSYISDAEVFVELMRRHDISRLISLDNWGGAIERGMALQNAGLKVQGFQYIERAETFFREKRIDKEAGLVFTF